MMGAVDEAAVERAKAALRREVRDRRRSRPAAERDAAAAALAERVLDLDGLAAATTVSAYVSWPGEPGTAPLLAVLRSRGVRVLLPVLVPEHTMDWAEYEGEEALGPCGIPGNDALLEPTGPRLGPEAVASSDLVLVPALAAGLDGSRLGQGGGYYDRALARLGPDTEVVAVVYDDEVLPTVPTRDHDRRMSALLTPGRMVRAAPGA